jgi:hypothetical protein
VNLVNMVNLIARMLVSFLVPYCGGCGWARQAAP